ncbi:hypothetical protein B0H14DRAFT_2592595 [Mycena olivaceomarginata]|nr:hypothetical protein B0H14DRAFT_2592595 [Mycena olivaceomarginata]
MSVVNRLGQYYYCATHLVGTDHLNDPEPLVCRNYYVYSGPYTEVDSFLNQSRPESRLQQEHLKFPALKEPFDPAGRAESVLLETEICLARSCIVAAASQLIAMVRSPVESIIETGLLLKATWLRL